MNIFLAIDSLMLTGDQAGLEGGMLGGIIAAIAAFLIFFLIIAIALYVYTSLAYMAIGKKVGLSTPGLAWIPGIGTLITAFQASKSHWWPWLLLVGYPLSIIPIIGWIIGPIASIVFCVYAFIWNWKMLEAIGRPGWWVLFAIIPVLGTIVALILLGVAAWGNKGNPAQAAK